MAHHRQIVEDREFIAARRAIDIDVRILDEILEGIIDVIARIPDKFGTVVGTKKNLRIVKTRDWASAGWPGFTIYFSFDAQTVTLLYICRSELDDSD